MRRVLLALLAMTAPAAAAGLPPAQTVDVPGAHLSVRDSGGAGMALILLHETTGTSENWAPNWDGFVAAGYRVIAFDRRGWGGSTPDSATGEQPGSIAADLDALAIKLNLSSFDLVGVAGGGVAALDYLGWHPERVHRAVIGASFGGLTDPPFPEIMHRLTIPALAHGPASDLELGPSYRATEPEGVAEWQRIEAGARQKGAPDQPLHTPNTAAKLQGVNVPVLVIAGDADLLAPPALMQMWSAHLPHRQFETMADTGHSIAWEKPAEFNRLVLTFLGAK